MALGSLFGGRGGANEIRVAITADGSQVPAGVAEATSGLQSGMSKLASMAALGYAAAGAAVVGFAKQSIDAAMESEDAQARLADTYARFPALHDVTLKSLNDLADATLKKTRFDDEAVRASEAVLAQFHLTGSQITQLIPLVTDYATKTGKLLPDAAESIGKALLGNTRALKEVGINYKLTGDAATDYANIVRLLSEQVGGAAAADAETTAGKLAILKNEYGELQEAFGAALLPLINDLAPALIWVLNVLADSFRGWGLLFDYIGEKCAVMGANLASMWADVMDVAHAIGGAFTAAWNAAGAAVSWVSGVFAWVAGVLGNLWGVVLDVAGAVSGVFAGAWHAAVGAINAVAGAIGWVIDKLHALQGVWNAVSGFFGKLGSIVGLSAPTPPPATAAPTLAPSAYAAPALAAAGGAQVINLNLNVHGNVGDEALIGRRTVAALAAYVRTTGARPLRQVLQL